MVTLYLAAAFVMLWAISFIRWTLRRCTIPGPRGWPFVGIYLSLGREVYKDYAKLSMKYGDIFSCHLGNECAIIMNKYEIVYDLFQKRQGTFNNRFACLPDENSDIPVGFAGLHYGDRWKEMRSFTIKVISSHMLGDRTFEDLLKDEVSNLCNYIINLHGESDFQPNNVLQHFVGNIMLTTVFGKRMEYTSQMEDFTKATATATQLLNPLVSSWSAAVLQILFYLNTDPFKRFRLGTMASCEILMKCVRELAEHQKAKDSNRYHDLVDSFYTAADETKLEKTKRFYTKTTLLATTKDLLSAGVSTTGAMLSWIILLLTKHQDVQQKLRREVDEVVGRDGEPTLKDKDSMNYLKAVIQEVHRFVSLFPVVYHISAEDAEYQGHFIPKGSFMAANLWGIHHDEGLFPKPFDFNPGRFLTESGDFTKSKHVKPFGIGRRSCPGEVLSQKLLFMLVTKLFQTFETKPPKGVAAESMNIEGAFDGVLIYPPPFKVRFIKL